MHPAPASKRGMHLSLTGTLNATYPVTLVGLCSGHVGSCMLQELVGSEQNKQREIDLYGSVTALDVTAP